MTIWVGFVQTAVPYVRDVRYAGVPKYTLRKLIRLAFDGMSSFSYLPLQLATWVGFTFATVAFLAIPAIIGLRISGSYLPGFASITIVVLLASGINLMALGVIGEYIGRIYDEVRGRPLYIVSRLLNVPPSEWSGVPADKRHVELSGLQGRSEPAVDPRSYHDTGPEQH